MTKAMLFKIKLIVARFSSGDAARSLLLCLLLGLFALSWGGVTPKAIAAISRMEEAPGQILYQSRHTLRDELGEPWQVVFFKRDKIDTEQTVHLRLVGFPDIEAFDHPQPLEIVAKGGNTWQAEDVFARESPAENVGEFDLKGIIPQLPQVESVQLRLSLNNSQKIALSIPAEVVLEWHSIAVN